MWRERQTVRFPILSKVFFMAGLTKRSRLVRWCLGSALALLPLSAYGQLNSSSASVTLNATLAETLTIVPNVTNVNFTLVAGQTATGSVPVQIVTTWVLKQSRSAVNLYGWFVTPAIALTDGLSPANNISSTLVLGQVTTGAPTTFTAFTQTNALGTASGGLELFAQSITSSNRSSTRTDSLNLEINLSTLLQLPAGTYTGTLMLEAQSL